MQSIDNPLAVIRSLGAIDGLRILDVGCGSGGLAKQLCAAGAIVSGIDPGHQAVKAAAATVPSASFTIAVAESLPFEPSSFDRVLMVNTLHHVPQSSMFAALIEAMRVLTPDGMLIVIEPTASGNFFEALRLVEDETLVRVAAQTAMDAADAGGSIRRVRTLTYIRSEKFDTPDQFLERIVAVDPTRGDVVKQKHRSIVMAIEAAAQSDAEGKLVFEQPIKVDIFRRPTEKVPPNDHDFDL
ncbi:class I SAM-dependent methyltransferase [Mesorhizobium sp. M4A.F.Ca.ET.022.05.2.1]|uniref:class I SAM-dependent methyltransferase n=1 Tax=Mesorhizobium sp. M4A.F.Ca.ET.022.05.2.1 TaxID=2496653 RepID=UPI000FCA69C2|nr:class I SAM-dependent methyltransferase [Mesorhizobium sp. M4A.F.Ca.ET.022.05.2.1]